MDQSHKRLLKIIDYLKDSGVIHKQQDIVDTLGISKANVSRALNGVDRYFTTGFLKRFADAFSDYINKDWLLYGVGEMVKFDKKRFRPHVPIKVSAGYADVALESAVENDCKWEPIIPYLPSYDFTIDVQGDSMYPVLSDGDTIACRWIDYKSEVDSNKIYVLDTEYGAVVKQIIATNKDETLCHSINPAYHDYPIPSALIKKAAHVVGLVRPI